MVGVSTTLPLVIVAGQMFVQCVFRREGTVFFIHAVHDSTGVVEGGHSFSHELI